MAGLNGRSLESDMLEVQGRKEEARDWEVLAM